MEKEKLEKREEITNFKKAKLIKIIKQSIFLIILCILGIVSSKIGKSNPKLEVLNDSARMAKYITYVYIIFYPINIILLKDENIIKKILKSLIYFLVMNIYIYIKFKEILFSQIFLGIILSVLIPNIVNVMKANINNINNINKKNTNIILLTFYYLILALLLITDNFNLFEKLFKEYYIGLIPIYKTVILFLLTFLTICNYIFKQNENEKEKEKQNKKIIKKIIKILILFLIIILSIFYNMNKLNEKYIDTTKDKKYKVSKNAKEQLKLVNKKTYLVIKEEPILEDINIILKNVANTNKNIVYVSNINKKIKTKDEKDKEEIQKFKDFLKKEKDDGQTIYILTIDENKKSIKKINNILKEITYIENDKYKFNIERKIVNGILSADKKEEIENAGHIGIINNIGSVPAKDYSKYIQDLEYLGYKFENVDVKNKISENIKLLFLIGFNRDLTTEEKNNLLEYLDKGKHILIAASNFSDIKNKKNINEITKKYGANFKDVQILEGNNENRYFYKNEENIEKKLDELEKMYKKGTTVEKIDEKQKEIQQEQINVNNDIIFANINQDSKIAKNINEFNNKIFTLLPGIISLDNNFINENKIKIDTYFTTSENASIRENYKQELKNEVDINKYLDYAVDKNKYIISVNLERKNGSKMTLVSNLGSFVNEFSNNDIKAEPYNEMENKEILVEMVNVLMENKYIIKETKYINAK